MKTVLSALALLAATAQAAQTASVLPKGSSFVCAKGIQLGALAVGSYTDQDENAATSGFGELSIQARSNESVSSTTLFKAMGFLEGCLTANRIAEHRTNILSWARSNFKAGVIPQSFQGFFDTQDAWARSQVKAHPSDARWAAAGAVISQLDGLVAGYNSVSPDQVSLYEMQLVQATGDLLDLIPALNPSEAPQWHTMKPKEVMTAVRKRSHCSALIKVLGDMSELFVAQVAWFTYGSMQRIYKTYDVGGSYPGRVMSFSSYPGLLTSLDDFYMMQPSNMSMVQTTNNIFNMSLYKAVGPQSLFAWQRVRIANLLANGGGEWVDLLRQDNSG
jgi:hypothetical protein